VGPTRPSAIAVFSNYFADTCLKKQTMSKDKGNKEKKKAPAAPGKKSQSDYQAGKGSSSSIIPINKK